MKGFVGSYSHLMENLVDIFLDLRPPKQVMIVNPHKTQLNDTLIAFYLELR